jgi:hypothetical protein
MKHTDALRAIQGDYFDRWVNNDYLSNIKSTESKRKAQELSTSENLVKALAMNGLIDTSHLERLTKKNNKVQIGNVRELAEEISKGITHKPSKGL